MPYKQLQASVIMSGLTENAKRVLEARYLRRGAELPPKFTQAFVKLTQ